ncbi:hypothetical protein SLEP1_g24131 [Rubroshorea leprosula]|uniref:F-box domain-containing protein n=1 Tax=Rubroshorea leprosula TaxID=152421 RepID=A0AAV5JP49_9ROSI|nr:hypothetical protein SLEP1_g24131 [Rubroshorea leprosula]
MGTQLDFLSYLNDEMSGKIFTCLDDPSDIARVSCVSHSWRNFVIANGFAKHLCLRMFPQLSRVDHVVEPASMAESLVAVGSSNMEWETLKKEHRAYAFLARGFMSFPEEEKCISEAIIASSTDHPWESIDNTLEKNDVVGVRASYWSSKGYSNPVVPEALTYKLVADLCVVTEIRIKPDKEIFGSAYFEHRFHIYSAKSVRFRMGHLNPYYNGNLMDESCPDSLGDKFVWTYTSQDFPMVQVGSSSSIDFPHGSYVAHVQVVGRPLSPAFGIEILEPSENFVLKALSYTKPQTVPQETRRAAERWHRWLIDNQQIMNIMRGTVVDLVEYQWEDEDSNEESDENSNEESDEDGNEESDKLNLR